MAPKINIVAGSAEVHYVLHLLHCLKAGHKMHFARAGKGQLLDLTQQLRGADLQSSSDDSCCTVPCMLLQQLSWESKAEVSGEGILASA